jgi:hypothetical protein
MTISVPANPRSATLVGARARVRLFTVAWAFAHLIHLVRHPSPLTEGFEGPVSLIGFLAAIAVLVRPSESRWFALMALMGVLHTALLLPFVVNHAVILSLVNLTILSGWIQARAWRAPSSTDWFARVEPFIRLSLIAAYGWAALSKINPEFFRLPGSCAVTLFQVSALGTPWEAYEPGIWLAYVVAGAELAIPALLAFSVTRAYGILLALTFHLALVAGPYSPGLGFTWVLYALLVPFLATPTAERYAQQLERLRAQVRNGHQFIWPVVVALPLGLVAILTWAFSGAGLLFVEWSLPFSLATLLVLSLGPSVFRDRRLRLDGPLFAIRGVAQVLIVVLLMINAASPYLGGKTIASFTMYSNLSTEGGKSNHLFIPRLPIETSQDDLVEIVESSNPTLNQLADEELMITWHELRREMSADPDAALVYTRGGTTYALASARENPELVSTDPVWHRLVAHRLVAEDGRCFW